MYIIIIIDNLEGNLGFKKMQGGSGNNIQVVQGS